MTTFDTYFPFDVGPGANTGQDRWRRMAQIWCDDGITRGVGDEFTVHGGGFFEGHPDSFLIGTGGVWVNGFYAEKGINPVNWTAVQTPGGNGIIVARLDPHNRQVQLVWRPGAQPHEIIRDPNGWWETLLFHLVFPNWARYARLVPIEQEFGMAEIPAWVARGAVYQGDGPGTQTDATDNQVVHSAFMDWSSRWEPGRDYRITCHAACSIVSGSWPIGAELVGIRWSDQAVIVTQSLSFIFPQYAQGTVVGFTDFTFAAAENAQINIRAHTSGGGTIRFAANSCRIEIDDLGRRFT